MNVSYMITLSCVYANIIISEAPASLTFRQMEKIKGMQCARQIKKFS